MWGAVQRREHRAQVVPTSGDVQVPRRVDALAHRQRGFEPLQQEQMVLQYVENHGSISRAETAELCLLSAPQAYRLLQSLVGNRRLRRTSKRGRNVRYELETE